MVWAAIGTAVAGSVAGAVVSGALSDGGGGGGSSSPAAAADPFAGQRQQYQQPLQALMASSGGQGDIQARQTQRNIALGQNPSQQLTQQMSQMLQPGFQFSPQDPSYQFRLQQGQEAVNRGAAKSGLLDSGNRLAALQDYGQGMASTEYGAQLARLQSGIGTAAASEQQQFNQLGAVDLSTQNIFQNNFSRLAQLSGANVGSPGQAGQLLQQQQAGAAAQGQQWGSLAFQGGKELWNMATSPAPGTPASQVNVEGQTPAFTDYGNW